MTRRISSLAIAVMIMGSGTYGAVSDHVLKIEMSSSYNYDFPGVPLHYEFKAEIQVDATVVSGSLQVPDGSVYAMSYYSKGLEAYLIVEIDGSDPSVWDGFGAGTYTFTVNYVSGPSDSTSIDYQLPSGDPIPYVTQEPQFVYPQHDAIDVPLHCTFQFDPASNPDHMIDIWIEPEDGSLEALSYNIMFLPHDTSSYGPVTLSPDTLYEGGYTINHYVNIINADGIPTEIDTDAETQILFTTVSQSLFAVAIDIKPETLNLKSKGVFTAFIKLPEGYGQEDLDISTVECEGAPAVKAMMADDNRLIVKFNREDLVGVSAGDAVELIVIGQLLDGTVFVGSDTIRVIDKGGRE